MTAFQEQVPCFLEQSYISLWKKCTLVFEGTVHWSLKEMYIGLCKLQQCRDTLVWKGGGGGVFYSANRDWSKVLPTLESDQHYSSKLYYSLNKQWARPKTLCVYVLHDTSMKGVHHLSLAHMLGSSSSISSSVSNKKLSSSSSILSSISNTHTEQFLIYLIIYL